MKQYKAIFFDWDGTAVQPRKAPVDEVAARMRRLLAKGENLFFQDGELVRLKQSMEAHGIPGGLGGFLGF